MRAGAERRDLAKLAHGTMTPPDGLEAEAADLMELVRAGIGGQTVRLASEKRTDWDGLIALAQENRLLGLAARGLARDSLAPPAWTEAVRRYRELTLRCNGAVLALVRDIIPAFAAAGVEVVVIKGPMAQIALYSECFLRPSGDLDLLVRHRDFEAAGRVLLGLGYSLPAECETAWWRYCLGEQHFLHAARPPIDLHHRIQQPGCPAPWSREAFLSEGTLQAFGGQAVPVLPRDLACLTACISLLKGLLNREPGGAHACDVYVHLHALSPGERAALMARAARLGLARTLAAAWRIACLVLGEDAPVTERSAALPGFSDADLCRAVLSPGTEGGRLPRRARLLSWLCDTPGAFVRELAWTYASEAAGRVFGRGEAADH